VAEEARRRGWNYLEALRNGLFTELGRGAVDFGQVFALLKELGYRGFATVEQDVLPGMGTPKESALRSRAYLRRVTGW
jgi:inosose dehydratase